ncbi:ABC transporter substrate-binding protein [Vaginella massiliensis]|uniref:ABC transporter substrate-binding protein n=1 Tax=Vaginella massiliensis TaxID=1816680 RepID=UPI00083842F0|nr:ABC transporter substrate-binding protein [Vaginella massiliensis]
MFRTIILCFSLLFLSSCKHRATENSTANLLVEAEKLQLQQIDSSFTIRYENIPFHYHQKDLPFERIAITQTAIIGYLDELNALDHLIGVTSARFIYNHEIQEKIKQNQIQEIGNESELFVETILTLQPDLLIASSNPTYTKAIEMLIDNGVKVLILDDYKEYTPLGRAEYIKVLGNLVGRDDLANERFDEIKKQYLETKSKIAQLSSTEHSTLVNTIYGDVWYLPAKNSLQAQFLKDAKANYLWADAPSDLQLNLSFEEVYAKAQRATHWINAGDFKSLEQMKASRSQYAWFEAFRHQNVYNFALRTNQFGGNDYFEKGVVRPDLILKDLGKIFYPVAFADHEFVFYQKLK